MSHTSPKIIIQYSLFALTLFWAMACNPTAPSPPTASQGILDLTSWDFAQAGTVNLGGEWAFYWQQLLTPTDFSSNLSPPLYVPVPGPWVNYRIADQPLPGDGFATYHLIVKIKNPQQLYGLKIPVVGTAYKLWVNEQAVATTGVVGTTAATMQPRYHPLITFFTPASSTLHITVQVSNFHDRQGGLWHHLQFGLAPQIQQARENNLALDLMLFGGLLIMGLYHLALYQLRRSESSPFYFGIFCLLIAIRTLITGENFFSTLWPTLNWEFEVKVEYLTLYLGVPIFLTFAEKLYPHEANRRLVTIGQMLGLFFSLIVILTPAHIFTQTLSIYQIITLLSALYGIYIFTLATARGRESSQLFATGFGVFFITIINDILYSNLVIQTTLLAPLGVFLFVFVQAAVLAQRFMKAFGHIETLSEEQIELQQQLEAANENLAQKVADRTQELSLTLENLKTTQSQLVMSEKMAVLGQLVAGIAHEINTPLGAIRSSAVNSNDVLNEVLFKLPLLFQNLSAAHQADFFRLLEKSLQSHERLPASEGRQFKRQLQRQLNKAAVAQADRIADWLIDMEIYREIDSFLSLFQEPNSELIVQIAYELSGLQKSNRNIIIATERASKVVFALKNYSRQNETNQKAVIQLIDGLETVLTLYHRQLKDKVEILRQYETVPLLWCYPDELNQVWSNLIHNALQAMQGQTTEQLTFMVACQMADNQPHITVHITDNGPGIPPDIQSRIFEPFFTTKAAGEGSGLGLDICQKIVAKHNGFIKVASQPGQTTFTVWLPLVEKD